MQQNEKFQQVIFSNFLCLWLQNLHNWLSYNKMENMAKFFICMTVPLTELISGCTFDRTHW